MNRETYQPPTASGAPRGAAGNADDRDYKMQYICGDCGTKVELFKKSHIACRECAGRVLYKQRTKRYVTPSRN